MFLEGCIEFMSPTLILPLCCLNLHNHLRILHCFAYGDCALQIMSWAMGGLSCLSEQGQPFQGGLHFLSALVWVQCCPDPISGHSWAAQWGWLASSPASGLVSGHFVQLPRSWISSLAFLQPAWHQFLTPGTLWEPDFYHPVRTAALHYFSSCIPRMN